MDTQLFKTAPEFEIVSSRIFEVNKALLFSAFSNMDVLKKWWGPEGFTNTFNEFDFREGGRWRFIMHGPENGNYQNEVEFVKIKVPDLIAWKRISKPLFNVVFTFSELGERQTELIFRMVFDNENECNKIKKFAVEKNEENFDRLEYEIKKLI